MLEAEIIAHCAPTLAGIKTANMFTYTPENRDGFYKEIEEENNKRIAEVFLWKYLE